MTPTVITVLLGVWMFISAFLWPHSAAQFNNAWIVGVLVVTFGLVAMRGKLWGHYANVALGAWLLLSSFFLPTRAAATFWNHVLVGVVVFVLALAMMLPRAGRRRHYGPTPSTR